jgi:flagellar biosynthesis protein FlhB
MAEHRPFPASPRRRALARQAGLHAASPLVVGAAAAAAVVVAAGAAGSAATRRLGPALVAACAGHGELGPAAIPETVGAVVLPVLGAAAVAAVLAHLAQTRALWLPRRRIAGAPALEAGALPRTRSAARDLAAAAIIAGVAFAWLWWLAPRLATLVALDPIASPAPWSAASPAPWSAASPAPWSAASPAPSSAASPAPSSAASPAPSSAASPAPSSAASPAPSSAASPAPWSAPPIPPPAAAAASAATASRLLVATAALLASLGAALAVAWVVLGVLDAVARHAAVSRALAMTPGEKREDDRLAGADPRWRARRAQIHRGSSASDAVAGASVLLLGDGAAVAVAWDPARRPVPVRTASGRGARATQLLGLARRYRIAVHRDPALTAGLVDGHGPIPEPHWPRLAEIIAATRGRDRDRLAKPL